MRYDSNHDPNEEWVYNGADIDGSKVVWARDMGEAQNLELIRYFKDRKVWLMEPDAKSPRVSRYTQGRVGPQRNDAAPGMSSMNFLIDTNLDAMSGQ
jgi:hypothetical protein